MLNRFMMNELKFSIVTTSGSAILIFGDIQIANSITLFATSTNHRRDSTLAFWSENDPTNQPHTAPQSAIKIPSRYEMGSPIVNRPTIANCEAIIKKSSQAKPFPIPSQDGKALLPSDQILLARVEFATFTFASSWSDSISHGTEPERRFYGL